MSTPKPLEPLPPSMWENWMNACALDVAEVSEWHLGATFHGLHDTHLPPLRLRETQVCLPFSVWLGVMHRQRLVYQEKAQDLESRALGDALAFIEGGGLNAHDLESMLVSLFLRWREHRGKHGELWMLPLMTRFGRSSCAHVLSNFVRETSNYIGSSPYFESLKLCLSALATMEVSDAAFLLIDCAKSYGNGTYRRFAASLIQEDEALVYALNHEGVAVPSFDLDPGGCRVFDYGPRQITMCVRGPHDITFKSSESRVYSSIPPVRKSDHASMAKASKAQYTSFSKSLRMFYDNECRTFNQAMLCRRVWRVDQWEVQVGQFSVMHPFTHQLVWLVSAFSNTWFESVLKTEDGSWINADMDDVVVSPGDYLMVAHPCDFTPEVCEAWQSILADFEIVQPFEQMTTTQAPYKEVIHMKKISF